MVRDDERKALGFGQLLAICALNGLLSFFAGLKLNETKAPGLAVFGCCEFARQNGSERGESVGEVVGSEARVEVLDEDVSLTRLAQEGVALLPHEAQRPALDRAVVQLLKRLLRDLSAGEVDVGVAEGHTGNVVAKHADGGDGTDLREDLEEILFADVLLEVADVESGESENRRHTGQVAAE